MDTNHPQEILTIEDYEVICLLDHGGQASIYKVTRHTKLFAIKVYRADNKAAHNAEIEVRCFRQLSSNRVVTIVDFVAEGQIRTSSSLQVRPCIVMEFVEGGDLHFYLEKEPFPEGVCRKLFKQLISTIVYFQSEGIYHRDIKPANILFDSEFHMKLTDFGLAEFRNEGRNASVGTLHFMAPEILKFKKATIKSELFAAGIVLFSMALGIYPFHQAKYTDLSYRCIMENNFNKFWKQIASRKGGILPSKGFQKLFQSLIRWEEKCRMSVDDILEDQWFQEEEISHEELKQFFLSHKKILIQEKHRSECASEDYQTSLFLQQFGK